MTEPHLVMIDILAPKEECPPDVLCRECGACPPNHVADCVEAFREWVQEALMEDMPPGLRGADDADWVWDTVGYLLDKMTREQLGSVVGDMGPGG